MKDTDSIDDADGDTGTALPSADDMLSVLSGTELTADMFKAAQEHLAEHDNTSHPIDAFAAQQLGTSLAVTMARQQRALDHVAGVAMAPVSHAQKRNGDTLQDTADLVGGTLAATHDDNYDRLSQVGSQLSAAVSSTLAENGITLASVPRVQSVPIVGPPMQPGTTQVDYSKRGLAYAPIGAMTFWSDLTREPPPGTAASSGGRILSDNGRIYVWAKPLGGRVYAAYYRAGQSPNTVRIQGQPGDLGTYTEYGPYHISHFLWGSADPRFQPLWDSLQGVLHIDSILGGDGLDSSTNPPDGSPPSDIPPMPHGNECHTQIYDPAKYIPEAAVIRERTNWTIYSGILPHYVDGQPPPQNLGLIPVGDATCLVCADIYFPVHNGKWLTALAVPSGYDLPNNPPPLMVYDSLYGPYAIDYFVLWGDAGPGTSWPVTCVIPTTPPPPSACIPNVPHEQPPAGTHWEQYGVDERGYCTYRAVPDAIIPPPPVPPPPIPPTPPPPPPPATGCCEFPVDWSQLESMLYQGIVSRRYIDRQERMNPGLADVEQATSLESLQSLDTVTLPESYRVQGAILNGEDGDLSLSTPYPIP